MENQQEMDMTPEELAARKEEMLRFYTESMPYLNAQLSYEKMLCDIDEARFKRSSIQYQYAMMMQSQQEQSEEPESEEDDTTEEPVKRHLKKQN